MYYLRISSGRRGLFHRLLVIIRKMQASGESTSNASSSRMRDDSSLCTNLGESTGPTGVHVNRNRFLERFNEDNRSSLYSYIGTVGISLLVFLRWFLGLVFLGPAQHVWRTFDRNLLSRNVSKTTRIYVVDSVSSCDKLLQSYRSSYPFKLNFLGMDCEWVNKKGHTNTPVALLQIATPLSHCFLVQLCKMNGHLPQTVRDILEDKSILKFGVGIKEDAKRLTGMFGVQVMGCVDLRHVVERCQVDETVQERYMLKIICCIPRHQVNHGRGWGHGKGWGPWWRQLGGGYVYVASGLDLINPSRSALGPLI